VANELNWQMSHIVKGE